MSMLNKKNSLETIEGTSWSPPAGVCIMGRKLMRGRREQGIQLMVGKNNRHVALRICLNRLSEQLMQDLMESTSSDDVRLIIEKASLQGAVYEHKNVVVLDRSNVQMEWRKVTPGWDRIRLYRLTGRAKMILQITGIRSQKNIKITVSDADAVMLQKMQTEHDPRLDKLRKDYSVMLATGTIRIMDKLKDRIKKFREENSTTHGHSTAPPAAPTGSSMAAAKPPPGKDPVDVYLSCFGIGDGTNIDVVRECAKESKFIPPLPGDEPGLKRQRLCETGLKPSEPNSGTQDSTVFYGSEVSEKAPDVTSGMLFNLDDSGIFHDLES